MIQTLGTLGILGTLGTQLLNNPHIYDKFAHESITLISDGTSMWNNRNYQCRQNDNF
jgi:hypothetical protein